MTVVGQIRAGSAKVCAGRPNWAIILVDPDWELLLPSLTKGEVARAWRVASGGCQRRGERPVTRRRGAPPGHGNLPMGTRTWATRVGKQSRRRSQGERARTGADALPRRRGEGDACGNEDRPDRGAHEHGRSWGHRTERPHLDKRGAAHPIPPPTHTACMGDQIWVVSANVGWCRPSLGRSRANLSASSVRYRPKVNEKRRQHEIVRLSAAQQR